MIKSFRKFSQSSLGRIPLVLAVAVLAAWSGLYTGASVQRERRVTTQQQTPAQKTTPTPSPAPAVQKPTPSPEPSPAQNPDQTVPSPTPTPAVKLVPPPRTLDELRTRIREITAKPEFGSSQLAVKIASLDTGRVVYEENSQKWMQPASNLKLYTVAAALDRLGPDYRFVTSVYAATRPDRHGVIRGDLIVYGRGDPTFATRFNPAGQEKDYFRGVDELASRIVSAGVRRVEGALVGDESFFTGGPMAPGWEWDDLQWWYGAEVSALSINDNSLDLSIKPGARPNDPCVIAIAPSTALVTIIDRTKTTAKGTRELVVHRPLGQNVLEISGTMPIDDRGFTASVAISKPALLFATMLKTSLEHKGVTFTGQTKTIGARERADGTPLEVSSLVELASRQSPPLSVIAAQTMKPSQNLYTELLLRTLGKIGGIDPKKTSEESGIDVVRALLNRAGIESGRLQIVDGSGLSRGNLTTAEATLQLLIYMNRHQYSTTFRDSLPIAGVDGTLRNRMKNTLAMGNARAKTGSLSSATTLSGYVLSAAGERLVFSLMINNPPPDMDPRSGFTDAVAILLASFQGRS